MREKSIYCRFVKGAIDRFLAAVGIICFSWLYLILAIAIKIDDPKGPVIFKQERLGKNGKVYWMYKFRSMKVGAEHTGSGVYSNDKDDRITRIGHFLRKTSLDEIPQLFNILKGDMSFVGFRSPLTYHPWKWEEYTDEQRKMFALKPGITGWAQVNGRKTVEWNHRIELNVWYAENVSFLLDIKIFFMTVFKVFANSDNENTDETVKR
ncbi:sugar transferase [uncultured Ruminococcus sp.]|uniref:sugar transferase n=1 Tax=uncultured Ruminococcus sp. TaxID=165186 RepID=UPI0025FFBD04|nr:sugar transferase [uncultured Ruminococcus sp.]